MLLKTASFALLAIAVGAPAPQEDGRLPVPDAAAQKESEKLIKDLFKQEYAKRAAPDRQALARKLFEQAAGSKDNPASRFVLLRESADLAAEAQDMTASFKSLDELAKSYRVEGWKLKAAALATAAKSARTPEEAISLSGLHLRVADEAALAEEFEGAKKAIDAAMSLARKAKDMALVTKSQAKDKELADLKARADKLKKARETLASKPDDAASNLTVGHYEVFMRGNWTAGLPMLAGGTEGPLKDLASKDLANPADPAEQAAVGDGWWDLSEKEAAPAVKERLRMRAHLWYEKCATTVVGLNKAKVDKRMKALKSEILHRGTWVDMGDPKLYGKTGKPGDPIEVTRGQINPGKLPPGEYDGISCRGRIKTGSMTVEFELKKCATWIQTVNPHIMTGRYNPAESRWEPEGGQIIPVLLDAEYLISVFLKDGEFIVYLNAEEKGRLKTTAATISGFSLDSNNGTVSFDQIRIRKKE